MNTQKAVTAITSNNCDEVIIGRDEKILKEVLSETSFDDCLENPEGTVKESRDRFMIKIDYLCSR
jgi:hypothetical protein